MAGPHSTRPAYSESCDEHDVVLERRYAEALDAGLTSAEAWLFALDDTDVGLLRRLVAAGCPSRLIARIIL